MEGSDNYLVMNNIGMIIEQSPSFQRNLAGDISDIVTKANNILQCDDDDYLSIDLTFTNGDFVIIENKEKTNTIASFVEKKVKK